MQDIDVTELREKLERGDRFVFIDVREPYEYEEFNLGARLMPLGSLPENLEDLKDYMDEEIIVHCKSGVRSGHAKLMLQSVGFTRVRNLTGGVMEWLRVYGR